MAKQISELPLSKYFKGELKHACYQDVVDLAQDMKVHLDGVYPDKLIDGRRPNESTEIKKYRKDIWKAITKSIMGKVINELMKIRKSEEWSVNYKHAVPANIKEEETPQEYFEEHLPYFTSVTNWAFSVAIKKLAMDPNAVCLIIPKDLIVADNAYFQPYGVIFDSDRVIDMVDGDYCVLKSPTRSIYYGSDGKTKFEGDIYYVITTTQLVRYEQTSGDNFEPKGQWNHNLGRLPAFKLGGKYKEVKENSFIFESRLEVMLPYLDEALREYSDLQAEVVQHIHSEAVIYQSQECKKCAGVGHVVVAGKDGTEQQVDCKFCSGSGYMSVSPYGNLVVRPSMAGEEKTPWPPKQYIQKDTAIVKVQDERVDGHIYKALGAINMEFLAETPMVESGVAKAYDTDGLNTFVNSFAEDLVHIMDRFYRIAIDIRYHFVPDKDRKDLAPAIAVPQHFDYINSQMMIQKITNARTAKVHPVIIAAMETEYANAEFNSDPEVRDELKAIYDLDPFPGVSADERGAMLSNNMITKEDAVLSANIQQYIKRAISENEKFLSLPYNKKLEILKGYAADQIKASSAAADIQLSLDNPPAGK